VGAERLPSRPAHLTLMRVEEVTKVYPAGTGPTMKTEMARDITKGQ
jgi:hypothetical protein